MARLRGRSRLWCASARQVRLRGPHRAAGADRAAAAVIGRSTLTILHRRLPLALLATLVAVGIARAEALGPTAPTAPIVSTAPTPWPDDAVSRLEALALVETLNADLLSHDSATLTLDRWCGAHAMAVPARVTATRVRAAETPADEAVRRSLGVEADEPVRHRHVRLACGTHVLSEADNWYVPARLTPEMNRVLDSSDVAFGRAVASLGFQRRTLSVERLWDPLPAGWAAASALPAPRPGPLPIPSEVLRHRAVLVLPDGRPFSALVETYGGEILAFPQAPPR